MKANPDNTKNTVINSSKILFPLNSYFAIGNTSLTSNDFKILGVKLDSVFIIEKYIHYNSLPVAEKIGLENFLRLLRVICLPKAF